MLVLSKEDVRKAITMQEAIDANRQAYIAISKGDADVPLRHHISTADGGVGLIMPGYIPSVNGFGLKFVSVIPKNQSRGLPVTLGAVLLFNPETGVPLTLMDGTFLTALRTGAGTGVATDLLARRDSRVLTIFGAGGQADSQMEAVLAVRPIEIVLVHNRTHSRAVDFCRRNQGRKNLNGAEIELQPLMDASEATERADILVTATSSPTPVFSGKWLSPGAHVNAIGSHDPELQEIDIETIQRAGLVTADSRDGAVVSGDLAIPLQEKRLRLTSIIELGNIAIGKHRGRRDDREITVFKSVGHAAQDLVVGRLIYEKARQLSIGIEVNL